MQPSFEPSELKRLIELAYLGEWMINAHHDNEYQDEAAFSVMQKLMAAAQPQLPGIERDVETSEYFLNSDWADQLYDQHILDYDDHVFWDELTERLAQRDLAQQRGVPMEQVNRDDDLPALRPLEERYRRELEEHGLDRLDVAEDF